MGKKPSVEKDLRIPIVVKYLQKAIYGVQGVDMEVMAEELLRKLDKV